MIDIIIKLIDRCIELLKAHKEHNREFFEDFVEPIFEDFNKVHSNYLTTFQAYRELLQTWDRDFNLEHPIFDQIRKDNLFSSSERTKLDSLEVEGEDSSCFSDFIRVIQLYLHDIDFGFEHLAELDLPEDTGLYQVARTIAAATLRHIFQKSTDNRQKQKEAIGSLDFVVATLQQRYGAVYMTYYRLKQECLISGASYLAW